MSLFFLFGGMAALDVIFVNVRAGQTANLAANAGQRSLAALTAGQDPTIPLTASG